MGVSVVADIQQSPGESVKVFKVWDVASNLADISGANALTLTGFSPMDYVAPKWKASTVYNIGDIIQDSNNNFQRCTTAGTSGTAAPTWQTSSTTTDNTGGGTVVWTFFKAFVQPQFGNGLPDPLQVRVRAYSHSNTSPSTTACYASIDVATWRLNTADATQTSILVTLICSAETGIVILEVPAA